MATNFNCYLCGETIDPSDDHERVNRGSLTLWAHSRCLAAQEATDPETDQT
jgi:hypothetical protein